MKVSVVMVSFRTGNIIFKSLSSLLAEPETEEILLIDNGNPAVLEKELDILAGESSKIRLLRTGRNLGFAAGCNLGAREAGGDYLVFVNPDLIVSPGSFKNLLEVISSRKDAWLFGARLMNMDGSEQRGGRREVLTPWRAFVELTRLDRLAPAHPYFRRFHILDGNAPHDVSDVPTISGAFMAISKQRFLMLGGFDERMFLHLEDIDLCLRAINAGGGIVYCGNVPVYHARSTSDVARCFVEWHKTRSSAIYFFKHFQATYPHWSLTLVSLALLFRFLLVSLLALPHDLLRLGRRLIFALRGRL